MLAHQNGKYFQHILLKGPVFKSVNSKLDWNNDVQQAPSIAFVGAIDTIFFKIVPRFTVFILI